MSRVTEIILRVRDKLADPDKNRWSDSQLLRIMSDGQKDLARHSKLLKGTLEIHPQVGQTIYPLPDDLFLLVRATFNDLKIALTSHDQMDEQSRKESVSQNQYNPHERHTGYGVSTIDSHRTIKWDDVTSAEVERLIYDNRDLREIKVFPTPDDSIVDFDYTFENSGSLVLNEYVFPSAFGLLSNVEGGTVISPINGVTAQTFAVNFTIDGPSGCNGAIVETVPVEPVFGVATALQDLIKVVEFDPNDWAGVVVSITDYTFNSVFGVCTQFVDEDIVGETIDTFGFVTNIFEVNDIIKIWYIRLSGVINSLTSEIELHPLFDDALKFYTIGHAFLQDNDAGSRQKGLDSLALYERELILGEKTEAKDGTRSPSNYTTTYRNAFE